ncbi:MAG TPA: hypothetical protein H9729_06915 [Candidatus Borkfalkia excrementigallinarum]|uniref:Uncharacterized protein n=1 Tax=Candidatus Borkfalkia excrementigallinarum TaxID=2838506 RepID=A0A9D1ZXB8_9FIRM|nr:hypothetical protein [Candidatus Borkfalkia excrementigallinarum]
MKEEDQRLMKTAHTVFTIIYIALAAVCVGLGIYCFVCGDWFMGLLALFGGLLLCYGAWMLTRLILLHIENVQAIRDKLCGGRTDSECDEEHKK